MSFCSPSIASDYTTFSTSPKTEIKKDRAYIKLIPGLLPSVRTARDTPLLSNRLTE